MKTIVALLILVHPSPLLRHLLSECKFHCCGYSTRVQVATLPTPGYCEGHRTSIGEMHRVTDVGVSEPSHRLMIDSNLCAYRSAHH